MTTSHHWQSQDWAQNDVRQIQKIQGKKGIQEHGSAENLNQEEGATQIPCTFTEM